MTAKSSISRQSGAPGYDESEKFDPTREAMELNVMFNDPNIRHDAFVYPATSLNSIGTRFNSILMRGGRFSKKHLRRWIAKNLWA